jgi:hypothetical protein
MKTIAAFLSLALVAACSEPPPPPKPAAPQPAPQAAAPKIETSAPPPPPVVAKPDPNKELAGKVKQALEAPDAKLPSGAIDVTAADGKVTLWGAVGSEAQRKRAGAVAGKIDGVTSVDNQLKVVRGS